MQCAMLTWSYFMAAFSDPGTVPPGWHPFSTPQVCCDSTLQYTVVCTKQGQWITRALECEYIMA
jgi:hypothetical protein